METMDEILNAAKAAEAKPASEEQKVDEQKPAEVEISDDALDAALRKKYGYGLDGIIKKEDQKIVLSEEQKQELEKAEQEADLKFGLDNKIVTKEEYDSFVEVTKGNKVDVARKKFIDHNKDLEDAGKVFDRIARLHEDDEFPDGETTIPNLEKKSALSWLEKIAEDDINSRYAKIKDLPNLRKAHLAEETLKAENTKLITTAIAEIPKRLEVDIEGEKYGVELTDADIQEATTLVTKGALTQKDLKPEEVKANAQLFFLSKNVKRLLSEGITVAVAKAKETYERGMKGIPMGNDTDTGAVEITDGQALVEQIRKNGT